MRNELLTIKEFAQQVHYSERSIRQMCEDGKINAKKLGSGGGKWLIPVSELERLKSGGESSGESMRDEKLHKRQIRKVAQKLAESINLPSYRDKDLWNDLPIEFHPGEYSLPLGMVGIGIDKQIKVNYHNAGAGIAAPHLIKGLYNHLSTSGLHRFSELGGDKGKLDNWEGEVARYSEALLKFLLIITEEVRGYGAKVSFHDEVKPGLTKWFVITAWSDALQQVGGRSWIEDSWYKTPEHTDYTGLWQLQCGAYSIGIVESEETLKQYESWHKELRAKYSKHQLAQDIHAMTQELETIAQDNRQRLREFIDMQRLPGHCELCSDA